MAGISQGEMLRTAPWYLMARIKAQNDQARQAAQQHWEVGRYIAFHAVVAYSKNIDSPTDLGLFPWEKERMRANGPTPVPQMSEEESRKMDEYIQNKYTFLKWQA